MIKPFALVFVIISLYLNACIFTSKDPAKHKDFMEHCDCNVNKDDVLIENYSFGRVEYFDTTVNNACARLQLKNAYLLYYNKILVAVYNEHPRKNIMEIEAFIKTYQTDSTRLSEYVKFDSSIRITVSRLCKDRNDSYNNGKFVDWRNVEYATITNPYKKIKEETLTTSFNWKN